MKIVETLRIYHKKTIERIINCRIGNVKENRFVKNRQLSFKDMIIILIGKKGRTIRMELFEFYKKAERKAVSKQDFSKQRMNIEEDFWIQANDEVVKQFYETTKYEKLENHIVIAIDGSKTILPRCKELEEKYGLANARNSQQKCVQCLISGCYDVLNHIMLNIEIAPYASDERELAKKNIEHLRKVFPHKKFLIIFDRGYPSVELINFLNQNKIKYLIRLQKNTYEQEKRNMKSEDENVNIELSYDRLTGKMSEKTKQKLKEQKVLKSRFVKCELTSGETEWLATNLKKKKYNKEKLKELYFKRWNIEIAYNTLKNKLEIENITGKKDITARQDIYATIIVYNMIESMLFLMKDEMVNKEENKYNYKINENILIGAFKDLFIEFVITEDEEKNEQLFQLFYQYVMKCKTAIIPNRSNPRNFKGGSLKCKVNMKRPF